MKNSLNKPIIGYLAPYGHGPKQNPTPIGMQTLVLGTPDQPYVQDIDQQGNVCGFLLMQPLAPNQYVALPIPTEPQVGQPHLCALVTSQEEPRSMTVATWMDIVGHALAAYPDMRAELLRHRVAGFRLAGFILGQLPRYVAASNCQDDLGFERYEFELNRLRMDDLHHYRNAPEVTQLAGDNGHNITPPTHSNNTPTPTP